MGKRRLGKGLGSLIPPSPSAEPQKETPPAGPGASDAVPAAGARLIDLSRIDLNPRQPRTHMDREALEGLAASIRENGVLQPVVVRPSDGGMFELVMGERRMRAAHMAGLEAVPALVREVPDDKMLELALVENVQREDLNPIEKARAIARMIEELTLTQQQAGDRLGLRRPTIANALRLLELPEQVQLMVSRGTLSAGHARAVLALGDPDGRLALARRIVKDGLSVREAEALAARGPAPPPRAPRDLPPQVRRLQAVLQEALGTRVEIRPRAKRGGRIVVHFADNDQFERLFEIFTGTEEAPGEGIL